MLPEIPRGALEPFRSCAHSTWMSTRRPARPAQPQRWSFRAWVPPMNIVMAAVHAKAQVRTTRLRERDRRPGARSSPRHGRPYLRRRASTFVVHGREPGSLYGGRPRWVTDRVEQATYLASPRRRLGDLTLVYATPCTWGCADEARGMGMTVTDTVRGPVCRTPTGPLRLRRQTCPTRAWPTGTSRSSNRAMLPWPTASASSPELFAGRVRYVE